MINPLQLLRDFRKWRYEKRKKALRKIVQDIVWEMRTSKEFEDMDSFVNGIIFGIEHRKEILKQVKI